MGETGQMLMDRLAMKPKWPGMSFGTAFRLTIAVAILARVAAVAVLIGADAAGVYAYEHGEIARNLLDGRGFSVRLLGTWGLTSQQAPVVPFLLAGCYAIAGAGSSAAHHLFFAIQAVEGGLLAAGTMALAARYFGRSGWAILAGLGAALYPPLVYSATHIQVVSTATTLLVWAFVALYDLREFRKPQNVIVAGLFLGLLALTDPILALAGVGASIAWFTFDRPKSRGEMISLARCWVLLVIVSIGVLLPWSIRNWHVHGRPVFVKSTFGYAFWQGNNRLSSGTDKVVRQSVEAALADSAGGLSGLHEKLWRARHEAGCVDDIALSVEDKKSLGQLPEAERSEELMRRARADLAAEPGRYAKLCLRRLRYYLWFDDTNPKTAIPFYRIPHAGLTIGAAAGLVAMGPTLRRKMAFMIIAFGLTAAFHAMTITAPRFHLPWEPAMIVWSVAGIRSCATAYASKRPVLISRIRNAGRISTAGSISTAGR